MTRREFQVWALMARGLSNYGIAAVLGVGLRCVEVHCAHIYVKLGLWNAGPEVNKRVRAVLAFV